jgi:hypothetical protein
VASIRVSSGTIPIDVNDAGDTIELRTDAEFMKACIQMQKHFQESKDKYDQVMSDDESTPEQQVQMIDQLFAETDEAIESLFGKGACHKIFPGNRSALQYVDFFDQLIRIMNDYQLQAADKYVQQNRQARRAQKK